MRAGFAAQSRIEPYRILRPGSSSALAQHATAADQTGLFVSSDRGADTGGHLDVVIGGIALVDVAGNITAGAPVTAGTAGKGVAATAGDFRVGFAIESGADGDRISVLLAPGIEPATD